MICRNLFSKCVAAQYPKLLLPLHEYGHHFSPPPRLDDNKTVNIKIMAGRFNDGIVKKSSIEVTSVQWPSYEKGTPTSESQDLVSFAETKPSPVQIAEAESPGDKMCPLMEEVVYPKGSKLALITLALCLAVFLFALVRPLLCTMPPPIC